MKLYHYSSERFVDIRTRRAQKTPTASEIKEAERSAIFRSAPGLYLDHISFFIEPPPLDIIGDLFNKVNHDVWVNGKTICEYVIDPSFFGNFTFVVTETPSDIVYRDKHWPDGKELTDNEKKVFFANRAVQKRKLGEIGSGLVELKTICQKFYGTTRAAFMAATANPLSEQSLLQYAADVPHLMVYPTNTVIKPQSVREVTIGKVPRINVSRLW